MSGWQTEWARTMADSGSGGCFEFSRSLADPVDSWAAAKIVGQADASWQGVRDAVAGFVLSPAELAEFSKCRPQTGCAIWLRGASFPK